MRRLRCLRLLLIPALLTGCSGADGPLIRVVNADSVTLDRVMIAAAGSEYALGRLLPGTAGQVRPVPAPDSTLQVRHQAGGPFGVAVVRGSGVRVIEIRLLADSVAGVSTETR